MIFESFSSMLGLYSTGFLYGFHIQPPPNNSISLYAHNGHTAHIKLPAIMVGSEPVPFRPHCITVNSKTEQLRVYVSILKHLCPIFADLLGTLKCTLRMDWLIALIVRRKTIHKSFQVVGIQCLLELLYDNLTSFHIYSFYASQLSNSAQRQGSGAEGACARPAPRQKIWRALGRLHPLVRPMTTGQIVVLTIQESVRRLPAGDNGSA
jgi:hypothetical protein